MHVVVLGGDGFCGWPTSLHLAELGHQVTIVDNLSRRQISEELSAPSLTPIAPIANRLQAVDDTGIGDVSFEYVDVARDVAGLSRVLSSKPEAVVHFAEQRAAPYSMRSPRHKRYSIDNNVQATHNLLSVMVEECPDAHLVHLGTMGVYGYKSHGRALPEGYLRLDDPGSHLEDWEVLYPTDPGSVYHLSKSLDQLMFQFYAKNDGLAITDLHQGVVWGIETAQTRLDPRLVNRFDYDGDYGTVLNRFLVQAAIGQPLTVHGSGGQTRAFINIGDSVRCIELALSDPPPRGSRVTIRNQMTETFSIQQLAQIVSGLFGVGVANIPNPRYEADENDLHVDNSSLVRLGLNPTSLRDSLLREVELLASEYAGRLVRSSIPCTTPWNRRRSEAMQDGGAIEVTPAEVNN